VVNPYRLEMDGSDDSIVVPSLKGRLTTGFTVEWWENPRVVMNNNNQMGSGWGNFACHGATGGSMYCGITVNQRFTATLLPAGTLKVGAWNHLAYVYDGATQLFYKDGVLIGPATPTDPPGSWNGFVFNQIAGSLGSFRIYSRGLKAAEIFQNYSAQVDRFK